MTFRNSASKLTLASTQQSQPAKAASRPAATWPVFEQTIYKRYARPFSRLLLLALAAALYACGSSPEPPKDGGALKPVGSTASKSASANPWGSFKVGSFVKTKTTVSAQMMGRTTDTSTETTTTLADLTSDKAVLDIATTVMGNTTRTRTEVPLSGAGPAGTSASGTAQNPVTGTDTVVVAGKNLDCKTMEVETEAAGTKVKTKTWTSDQVPGFLVKSVSTSTGAMTSTTTIETVDFKAN